MIKIIALALTLIASTGTSALAQQVGEVRHTISQLNLRPFLLDEVGSLRDTCQTQFGDAIEVVEIDTKLGDVLIRSRPDQYRLSHVYTGGQSIDRRCGTQEGSRWRLSIRAYLESTVLARPAHSENIRVTHGAELQYDEMLDPSRYNLSGSQYKYQYFSLNVERKKVCRVGGGNELVQLYHYGTLVVVAISGYGNCPPGALFLIQEERLETFREAARRERDDIERVRRLLLDQQARR